MIATSTEKHAELVGAGWSVRLDGLWRHPDPNDRRAFTLAAAWLEHTEAMKERR